LAGFGTTLGGLTGNNAEKVLHTGDVRPTLRQNVSRKQIKGLSIPTSHLPRIHQPQKHDMLWDLDRMWESNKCLGLSQVE